MNILFPNVACFYDYYKQNQMMNYLLTIKKNQSCTTTKKLIHKIYFNLLTLLTK